jgi:organic radical activating enzyme
MIISEDFYSIQGEGHTVGYPSYFVRLAHCNLTCGASRKEMNSIVKEELQVDPNKQWHGELHKQGLATWTCDSIPVWYKGIERDNQYLIDRWKKQNIYEDITSGLTHIIWTGGEPTMPKSQQAIVDFNNNWSKLHSTTKFLGYQEIETNGTFVIQDTLFYLLDQINCSAKLSNSGMSKQQRIKPEAIKSIMGHSNYWFKFVISSESDWDEVVEDFITPFNIPLSRVICMPGLDTQEDYFERTNFVCELAKKHKFVAGTRMHIASWGAVTGV